MIQRMCVATALMAATGVLSDQAAFAADSSSNWLAAADGSFNDAANWSTGFVPNAGNGGFATHDAIIDAVGADYRVTAQGLSLELEDLIISSPNATLALFGTDVTAAVTNSGTINVLGASSITGPFVQTGTLFVEGGPGLNASLALSESWTNQGVVVLDTTASSWTSQIVQTNGVFTNGSSGALNVLSGTGGARMINGDFTNLGAVSVTDTNLTVSASNMRHEGGSITAAPGASLRHNAGDFVWTGGTIAGEVFTTDSTVEIANSVTDSGAVRAVGNVTLRDNLSSTAVVRVEGGAGGQLNAMLTADGATNAGVIELETRSSSWNANLNLPNQGLTNSGQLVSKAGTGGSRNVTGRLVNQGVVDTSEERIDFTGELVNDGGSYVGGDKFFVRNSTITQTAAPAADSLLTLGSGNVLLSDNLQGMELHIAGGGPSLNVTLDVPQNATNYGTIRMETVSSSWLSNLTAADGFTNEGLLDVNAGTGGARQLRGDITNRGVIDIDENGLLEHLDGGMFTQADGVIQGAGGVLVNQGVVNWTGGAIDAGFDSRGSTTTVAATVTDEATILLTGGGGVLVDNLGENVTVQVTGGPALNAAVTADGAENRGTLQLQTISSSWTSNLSLPNAGLTNTGTLVSRAGTGGSRDVTGRLVNQGLVDTTDERIDFSGDLVNGGGAFVGGDKFFVRNATIMQTAAPSAPSLLTIGPGAQLISDNLVGMELHVAGGGPGLNVTLDIPQSATNFGEVRLETVSSSWASNIGVAPGATLTNSGHLRSLIGTGGTRTITADFVANDGAFIVEQSTRLRGTTNVNGSFINDGSVEVLLDAVLTTDNYEQRMGASMIDGELESSSDIMVTGGLLTGFGLVDADIVATGGAISPGRDGLVGELAVVGDVTFGDGALFDLDLLATGAGDLLAITGDLDLSALGDGLSITGGSETLTYIVATYTGVRVGEFDNVPAGYTVDYSVPGEVRITGIPEPASLLTLVMLGGLLLRRR